ncbi:hypothetical protein L249_6951 [Ophiocordyceps polyrhachis-furcata BCC 54312]|uniref:non-specific serine/threonine protein kinase n=1 Tax=Ophiocordyceps polyrhachis-furcata BCC 54312 TaxID=1330021 RepID=A0A367LJT2_9HYPO|nr:hypothetical protein L249_6951 [Ophiocordyceps polyrhachis-furcata BCC 54312]
MAQLMLDLLSSVGNCLNCFPGSPTLRINGRSFKMLRLLGEACIVIVYQTLSCYRLDNLTLISFHLQGGFSYVYLVEDTTTHQLLALKKIRCPFGAESVEQAMREVEAYRLFAHVPTIISAVDHVVATERGSSDESSKTVYILLPYYRRGNLQDMINSNLVNRSAFAERHLMMLFLGVCKALAAMHRYRPPSAVERMRVVGDGDGDGDEDEDDDDEERNRPDDLQHRPLMAPHPFSSSPSSSIHQHHQHQPPSPPSPSPTRKQQQQQQQQPPSKQPRAYAHRDIKPGNIMINDQGTTPILMDLGSVAPSPIQVTSQSIALQLQDTAAEHSTMPYRAPELFDVRPGSVVDSKSDIWSMGCTLFACLVGKSPFEMRSDETGGSLSLCVLGADWRFPDESPGGAKRPPQKQTNSADDSSGAAAAAAASISEPVRDIVRRCLKAEPAERPDITELIALVEAVIEGLPDDSSSSS